MTTKLLPLKIESEPQRASHSKLKILFFLLVLSFMSLYPIYTNYHSGLGLAQFNRHIGFLTGDILFPNPWQYRVLSHWLIEGMHNTYEATIKPFMDIEAIIVQYMPKKTGTQFENTNLLLDSISKPGFIEYNIIFVLIRYLQHMAIFIAVYFMCRKFIRNDYLIYLGLGLTALLIGNSVNDSDLAFNTYFDVLFYLATCLIVVYRRGDWLIVPISILASLNRETGMLIPVIYILTRFNYEQIKFSYFWKQFIQNRTQILLGLFSFTLFTSIFFGLRLYYGIPEYEGVEDLDPGLPILKSNLMSPKAIKTYFEMFGTLALLPLMALLNFKKAPKILKTLFFIIVPVWFAIHLGAAVAYQSRLFLVAALTVLLPMTLWTVENFSQKQNHLKSKMY